MIYSSADICQFRNMIGNPVLHIALILLSAAGLSACDGNTIRDRPTPHHPLALELAGAIPTLLNPPAEIMIAGTGKISEEKIAEDLAILLGFQTGEWTVTRHSEDSPSRVPELVVHLDGNLSLRPDPHTRWIPVVSSKRDLPLDVVPLYESIALLHIRGPKDLAAPYGLLRLRSPEFQRQLEQRFSTTLESAETDMPEKPASFTASRVGLSNVVLITAFSSNPKHASQSAGAAAETAESFFMEVNQREADDSVAWLVRQLELEKSKPEPNPVTLQSLSNHIEEQRLHFRSKMIHVNILEKANQPDRPARFAPPDGLNTFILRKQRLLRPNVYHYEIIRLD